MLFTIVFTIIASTDRKIFSLIEFVEKFFFCERKLTAELRFGLNGQPILSFIFRINIRGVDREL